MSEPFPFELIEILNGILTITLLWMTAFVIIHLGRTWKDLRSRYSGHMGNFRSFCAIYRNNKPEIALLTISFALFCRTFVLWYLRWSKDHRIENGIYLIQEHDIFLLMGFTALLIVGVACWIRVISPLEGRTAITLWVCMIVSSLMFGIGMHYLPLH